MKARRLSRKVDRMDFGHIYQVAQKKNVLNICMHYSPKQSKCISAKAYM